jgi:hypothetical protein
LPAARGGIPGYDFLMNTKKAWISLACVSLFLVWSPVQAGWQLKVGGKTFGSKSDQKPADSASASAPSPSIVCDSAQELRLCYAFSGKDNSEKNTNKGNEMACKFMRGRFLASSICSMEGALGKCTVLQGQPKEYTLYYYTGGKLNFDKASAERDCKNAKSSFHAQGAGVWSGF